MRTVVRQFQRVFVLLAGGALVLVGVGMLVLPGPGLLVIVGGLALLATEFSWADGLLQALRRQVGKAKERMRRRGGSAHRSAPAALGPAGSRDLVGAELVVGSELVVGAELSAVPPSQR